MQKLGWIPEDFSKFCKSLAATCPRVWFHAVSVGEFNALFPLVERFRSEHPEFQIFISTTTATGQEQAQKRAASFARVFYFPLDLPWVTCRYLDLVRPSLVGIVETEIWPGFISECHKRNINVTLINGRVSPRSYKGYMRWRVLFASVIAKFSALAVQSEAEKERYQAITGKQELHISVCGNIKLDGIKPANPAEIVQIRDKIGLKQDDLVLVAGSTHEGEESAMLSALKELNCSFKLILVPRHPERFDRVHQLIDSYGFRTRAFSRQEGFACAADVYLLDTIGQLNKYYGLADIAFVGGTLADIGGHNLVEPCAYKTAVICGPSIHKTRDMFEKLREREALLMVHDEKELISTIKNLLESPGKRQSMGINGNRFLAENQGALAKTLVLLEEYLIVRSAGPEMQIETVGGVGR